MYDIDLILIISRQWRASGRPRRTRLLPRTLKSASVCIRSSHAVNACERTRIGINAMYGEIISYFHFIHSIVCSFIQSWTCDIDMSKTKESRCLMISFSQRFDIHFEIRSLIIYSGMAARQRHIERAQISKMDAKTLKELTKDNVVVEEHRARVRVGWIVLLVLCT